MQRPGSDNWRPRSCKLRREECKNGKKRDAGGDEGDIGHQADTRKANGGTKTKFSDGVGMSKRKARVVRIESNTVRRRNKTPEIYITALGSETPVS